MKFVAVDRVAPSEKTPIFDRADILNASVELQEAFEGLTDAQKNLDEVVEIMNNIQKSIDIVAKYGVAGVEQLNMDGSLEDLCNIDAKLITAEKAVEALEQEKKTAFEHFKEFALKVYKFVAEFIKKVATVVMQVFTSNKSKTEAIIKATSFNMGTPAVGLLYREAFDVPVHIRNNAAEAMAEKVAPVIDWLDNQEGNSANEQAYQDKIREIADLCRKLANDSQGTIVFDESSSTLKFLGFGVLIDEMSNKGLLGAEGATLESLKYSEDDIRKIAKTYADQVHQFGTYSAKWERFWTVRLLKKNPVYQNQSSANVSSGRMCLKMLVSITLVSEQLNAAIAKHMVKYISVFYSAINASK